MDALALYRSKLTTPEQAVATIPSGSRLSMGMFAAEPPALLKALADRAAAGEVDDLRVYYYETARIAGDTILRYELNDRIHPYCMFVTAVERALIKRGMEDGGRKVINYVPSTFHQAVRLMTQEIGIDTFVCTVSPMDQHGYMSFRTGNDYSTKVARAAKRLIVEINENMPRLLCMRLGTGIRCNPRKPAYCETGRPYPRRTSGLASTEIAPDPGIMPAARLKSCTGSPLQGHARRARQNASRQNGR
jgi:acyl-CoA hydrolase